MLKRLSVQALYNLIDRFLKITSGLATFVAMGKIYPIDVFGFYALVFSIAMSVSILTYVGLEQYSQKLLSIDYKHLYLISSIKFIVTVPIALLYFISVNFFIEEVGLLFSISMLFYVSFNFNTLIFNYLNQLRAYKMQVSISLITFVVTLPLKFLAVNYNFEGLLCISVVLDVVIPFVIYLYLIVDLKDSQVYGIANFLKEHRKFIVPVFLSSVIVQINLRAESALLAKFMENTSDLSVYSLALRVADVVAVVISVLIATQTPLLYGIKTYSETISKFYKVVLSIVLFSFCVLTANYAIGGYVISSVFGVDYILVPYILNFIVLGMMLGGVSSLASIILIKYNYATWRLFSVLIGLLSTITFGVLLIPKFNLDGAAFTYVLSNMLMVVLSLYAVFTYKKRLN